MGKALTIRQKKFAAAYMVSTNATRAAIEAGYSEKSAPAQGHQLLNKPQVKAELALKAGELLKTAKHIGRTSSGRTGQDCLRRFTQTLQSRWKPQKPIRPR